MRKVLITLGLGVCLSFAADSFAADLLPAVYAWNSQQTAPVVKDGIRCSYQQYALLSNQALKLGHIQIGFRSYGCPGPKDVTFEFVVSRIRVVLEGPLCVFECTNSERCVTELETGKTASRASLYQAKEGSCGALSRALVQLAPVVESEVRAAEVRAERALAQARAVEEKRRAADADLQKRRDAARAECGPTPSVSGGPWIGGASYKTEAMRQVQKIVRGDIIYPLPPVGTVLCIKAVEYVGDAPSPTGGRWARVHLRAYHELGGKVEPITLESNFPY